MRCELKEDGDSWRCLTCGKAIPIGLFSSKPLATCRLKPFVPQPEFEEAAIDLPPCANHHSVKTNGVERTDAEVIFIISNYCQWCEHWLGMAGKKKCRSCGCGSTETIEHLHKRRIKNCPRKGSPAYWDEVTLQKRLHGEGIGE